MGSNDYYRFANTAQRQGCLTLASAMLARADIVIVVFIAYTIPCSSMACATFMKPAMLAPFT